MLVSAQVISNRQLDAEIFLLELAAPEVARRARPGQFVMLRASDTGEPVLARPFSIYSAQEGIIGLLYQVVGKGTGLLSRACPGQELAMWGPLGRGFELDNLAGPILVAGGIGIGPMLITAAALRERGLTPGFIYGVRGAATHRGTVGRIRGDLAAMGIIPAIVSEDGSLGGRGLVTAPLAELLHPESCVLACGPMAMLKAVAEMCAARGAACQVSLEAPMACGIGACLGCMVPAAGGGNLRVCQEGPVLDAALVDWKEACA